MNSNRLLFIGIGQCGNNIVNEFESKGYNTFAINTSELDLKTVNVANKFRIPGALGCARDRKKALSYLSKNYNKIFNEISNKFEEQDIIYLVFSLGGGTGSGISPLLLDAFSRKYQDKKFGAIVVTPSTEESIQCKINSIEAYNELIKIPNLKSVFILDNNTRGNKLDINVEFAKTFDSIVNMAIPNKKGVIDEYELEKLLTCTGNSIIMKFNSTDCTPDTIGSYNSIFLDYDKGCKYMGVSTVEDFDINILENEFGKPTDVFKGYNDKDNIVIVSGINFPMKYFKSLDKEIEEFNKQEKEKTISVETIDTSKYRSSNLNHAIIEDLDFDELLKNYRN